MSEQVQLHTGIGTVITTTHHFIARLMERTNASGITPNMLVNILQDSVLIPMTARLRSSIEKHDGEESIYFHNKHYGLIIVAITTNPQTHVLCTVYESETSKWFQAYRKTNEYKYAIGRVATYYEGIREHKLTKLERKYAKGLARAERLEAEKMKDYLKSFEQPADKLINNNEV